MIEKNNNMERIRNSLRVDRYGRVSVPEATLSNERLLRYEDTDWGCYNVRCK